MKRRLALLMAVALLAPLSASAASVTFDTWDSDLGGVTGSSIQLTLNAGPETSLWTILGLGNAGALASTYYLDVSHPFTVDSTLTIDEVLAGNQQHLGWYQETNWSNEQTIDNDVEAGETYEVKPGVHYGLYLNSPDGSATQWYSDPNRNPNGVDDNLGYRMLLLRGINPADGMVMAWEDLPEVNSDWDYNDLVANVILGSGLTPMPEPATFALFGLGLAGVALRSRKWVG